MKWEKKTRLGAELATFDDNELHYRIQYFHKGILLLPFLTFAAGVSELSHLIVRAMSPKAQKTTFKSVPAGARFDYRYHTPFQAEKYQKGAEQEFGEGQEIRRPGKNKTDKKEGKKSSQARIIGARNSL